MVNKTDKQYLDLLNAIIENGTIKESGRPGMPNTKGLFGYQMRFNLSEGFPLLTTKKLSFKNIAVELLWFLKGETNIKYLVDNGCNIWNDDAYRHFCKLFPDVAPYKTKEQFIADVKEKVTLGDKYTFGDLGGVYGEQWRNWTSNGVTIDQIKNVINNIRKNPYGRRHIVTAWNPAEVDNMALPPCHVLFQFNCRPTGDGNFYLDCALTQRSCDTFLGVPYNIASYALLTHLVAKVCGMVPGDFVHTLNDVHIYENHMEPVSEQLQRSCDKPQPTLLINDRVKDLNDIAEVSLSDLQLIGYDPYPLIKGELSVGV